MHKNRLRELNRGDASFCEFVQFSESNPSRLNRSGCQDFPPNEP